VPLSVQAQLEAELVEQAAALAASLRVPLLLWRQCTGPAIAAAGGPGGGGGGGGGGGDARAAAAAAAADYVAAALAEGKVALVELGGIAPFVYSNLNGLMERDGSGVITHAVVEPHLIESF